MDELGTTEAAGKAFDLYKQGSLAFAGFVGWVVAIWFVRLYVKLNGEVRELTVQLITSANSLSGILDKLERRAPRRRKPVTNPGFRPEPPETPE